MRHPTPLTRHHPPPVPTCHGNRHSCTHGRNAAPTTFTRTRTHNQPSPHRTQYAQAAARRRESFHEKRPSSSDVRVYIYVTAFGLSSFFFRPLSETIQILLSSSSAFVLARAPTIDMHTRHTLRGRSRSVSIQMTRAPSRT